MDNQNVIIGRIRQRFQNEYEMNGQLYHEMDVRKVLATDWEIERFVTDWSAEDKAYNALIKSLRWRQAYGVHERPDSHFPAEFYRLGHKERYGRDADGRRIQWECYRNDRTVSGFGELNKQFLAHIVNGMDSLVGPDGYTLVSDISGAGLRNVNYDLMRFRMRLMSDYYPQAVRRIIVVDLPAVLNAFTRFVLTLVSADIKRRISFVGRQELCQFVPPDAIPVRLDGPRHEWSFPDHLRPLKRLKHLRLTDDQILNYYKVYENVL